MAKQVIKRDGTKESFDGEKIRRAIEGASKDAGLAPERIDEVVNQVSAAVLQFAESKEEVATAELLGKILGELDKIEPAVAEAWKKYK
jgi:transcriptional regulator NrdR family protein